MLTPDFAKHSLALFDGNYLIYSSEGTGLRPLFDCLRKHKGKSGLILHDKVIGLAAAKLIVYSAIIAEVVTNVASVPAKKFLENNGIKISAFDISANIMTKDGRAVCPGDVIALNTDIREDFIHKIESMLYGPVK